MRVSVIVPTFNRAHMIARALDSIVRQTYGDVEVVVVDDGSTDNTAQIVGELAEKSDHPIHYHEKPNGGCASARNKGLELARGDLITFLDSDDSWVPDALDTLVSALTDANADFVYSPSIEVFPDGREVVNRPVAANRPESFAIEHFRNTNVRNGAFLIRREVLSKVAGLDESLLHNEDSDFLQRVAVQFRAAYADRPTVRCFHHGGNKSRDRVAIYRSLLASAEKVLSEYPSFALTLGDAADRRLGELTSRLVESLILRGDLEEARRVASSSTARLGLVARASLFTRSSAPMRARRLWESLRRRRS